MKRCCVVVVVRRGLRLATLPSPSGEKSSRKQRQLAPRVAYPASHLRTYINPVATDIQYRNKLQTQSEEPRIYHPTSTQHSATPRSTQGQSTTYHRPYYQHANHPTPLLSHPPNLPPHLHIRRSPLLPPRLHHPSIATAHHPPRLFPHRPWSRHRNNTRPRLDGWILSDAGLA